MVLDYSTGTRPATYSGGAVGQFIPGALSGATTGTYLHTHSAPITVTNITDKTRILDELQQDTAKELLIKWGQANNYKDVVQAATRGDIDTAKALAEKIPGATSLSPLFPGGSFIGLAIAGFLILKVLK